MNKLITLELKRNSLRPYHIAVLICGAAMLAFQYLMAAIPHIDPAEADIEMFSSYNFLIGMNNIVCMAIFAILAAVMAARFVVEEYTGKRAIEVWSVMEGQAELQETMAGAERVRQEYAQLINWAGMYDNCTFEAKKMIVAQFVKAVHVKRDYEIDIEFNVSFAEFQAIYLEPEDEDDKKPGANTLLALTEKAGQAV